MRKNFLWCDPATKRWGVGDTEESCTIQARFMGVRLPQITPYPKKAKIGSFEDLIKTLPINGYISFLETWKQKPNPVALAEFIFNKFPAEWDRMAWNKKSGRTLSEEFSYYQSICLSLTSVLDDSKDGLSITKKYITYTHPTYSRYLDIRFEDLTPEQLEAICKGEAI